MDFYVFKGWNLDFIIYECIYKESVICNVGKDENILYFLKLKVEFLVWVRVYIF